MHDLLVLGSTRPYMSSAHILLSGSRRPLLAFFGILARVRVNGVAPVVLDSLNSRQMSWRRWSISAGPASSGPLSQG